MVWGTLLVLPLSCFCVVPVDLWYVLSIRSDSVVSAIPYNPPSDVIDTRAGQPEWFPTVSTVFDRIEAERALPGGFLEAEYEVRTGLPVRATIGTMANDAGTRYELRRLQPVPPR